MNRNSKAELGTMPRFVKERIERLMVDLGGPVPLSYQELAARMGMDKGQLSKIVNGKQMVRLDTLQRMANAMGVPLSTLFDGEKRPPVSSMADFIRLMTTYHQDLLRALGELSP